jgi:hypothetical protein
MTISFALALSRIVQSMVVFLLTLSAISLAISLKASSPRILMALSLISRA